MSWLEMIITFGFVPTRELFLLPTPHPRDLVAVILLSVHIFSYKPGTFQCLFIISWHQLTVKTPSSDLCVGPVAAGHLQAQLEAATWTLLLRGFLHLLCVKGKGAVNQCI